MSLSGKQAAYLVKLAVGSAGLKGPTEGSQSDDRNGLVDELTKPDVEHLLANKLICRDSGQRITLTAAGRSALRRHKVLKAEETQKLHEGTATLPDPETGQLAPLVVNLRESPLAWLASRKDKAGKPLLDQAQLTAGEKLRSDFEFARLGPQVSKGWRVEPGAGRNCGQSRSAAADLSASVLATRARVERMLQKLDPGLRDVVVDVCCRFKGLETVEQERGWPARSARIVLLLALTSLARAYGFQTGSDRLGERLPTYGADCTKVSGS